MIELQPFARRDFPRLISWATSPEMVMQWAGSLFRYPLDAAQLDPYLRSSLGQNPTRRIYRVVYCETGAVVGHIELAAIDLYNHSATVARVLVGDPAMRGKGIGEAMLCRVLAIGFDELKLHRIELNVFDFNTAAIALYEKVGFVKEGHIRESRRMGDGYWSHYRMGMLEDEWRARHPDS